MSCGNVHGIARGPANGGVGAPSDDGMLLPASPIPIAIVGMACRFSGKVTNPSQLWDLCAAGKDGWSPIPESRFDGKGLYYPSYGRRGRSHATGGFFLDEDIALFDSAFFQLSSEVASALDPQARLLLETVYEATEDAGIPLGTLAGSNTSVYAGTFSKDYHEMQTKDAEVLPLALLAGTGTAMLANRISHFYDLQGPSMTIDTGCSSGLVAVHQACQSIRSGESNISIVGAASALLSQDTFISTSTAGATSAEGKCFSWDTRAHGYGRGEGVAVLILKPLDAALRDRDRIHAIIKDTGVNQDGKTATITSPSGDAQAKLIQECYKRAGLDLAETGYVEAHMTGTAVGDPIEAEAIARTFGASREAPDPVIVGSVKTNVGHTEAVSGLAAVIKTSFALKHRLIPPNLNYETTNPKIPLEEWRLTVPTTAIPWPENKQLRASVNNFGYGGTNAHAILEAAPSIHNNGTGVDETDNSRSYVFVVSAKDSAACQTAMTRLANHLGEKNPAPSPSDLAYTLCQRRTMHPWMVAIRAKTINELENSLRDPARKPLNANRRPRLGLVFNGQGAQWHAMGRELLTAYPVFGQAVRQADAILKYYGASWSLMDELLRDAESSNVGAVHLSQPISVAIQLALVDLLKSWGITPSAVTSHSSGEIAAAYAVGALSFREALGVAFFRGELAQKYQKLHSFAGGMLAAGVRPEDAEKYVADTSVGRAVVACVNSPRSVTISGDVDALDEVASRLEQDGVFARRLKVEMAYHSHHMAPIAQEYVDRLRDVLDPAEKNAAWGQNGDDIPTFISPVTGEAITSHDGFPPEHWARNMTDPVLFSQALDTMCFGPSSPEPSNGAASSNISSNVDMIIEVGAHSTLAGPILQILEARGTQLPYVSCLKRQVDAVKTMQDVAWELLVHGYPVDLQAVNSPRPGHGDDPDIHHPQFVTDLPSYPWNHTTRYWVEPRVSREQRSKRFPPHELLGTPLNGSNGLTPTWRNFLRLSEIEWLWDHQIDGSVVFPAAAYVAMAIEAARLLTDPSETKIRAYRLRDVDFIAVLAIPEADSGVEVQLTLRPCGEKDLDHDGWYEFSLCSLKSHDIWIEHCKGYVAAETVLSTRTNDLAVQVERPQDDSYLDNTNGPVNNVSIDSLFGSLRERGIYHGPEFQNLIDTRAAGARAITNFAVSNAAGKEHDYVLHPTTLDSILQASFSNLPKDMDKKTMVLPRFIGSLTVPSSFKRRGGDKLRAFSELTKADNRGYRFDIPVAAAGDTAEGDGEGGDAAPLQLCNFLGQAVYGGGSDDAAGGEQPGICSKSVWELDILHNVPAEFKRALSAPIEEHEAEARRRLTRMSYWFIHDAVRELEGESQDTWAPHHQRFFAWMKTVVEQGKRGELPCCEEADEGAKIMLAEELSADSSAGTLTVRMGGNLAQVVRGDIQPLELMMEGNLLNRLYEDHGLRKTGSYKHVHAVLQLYAAKNPGAKVIEIGGGTGAATGTVLEAFSAGAAEGTGTTIGHYMFTDISAGFFEAAKDKFTRWSSVMDFRKLDIEDDPVAQSFKPASYDLVVAVMVLHATRNLGRTMSNVRKLLKPGGTLLLLEETATRLDNQLVFGTLPGWWLGEEPERQMGPNVPLEVWDRVLRETGLTGVDFDMPDYAEPEFQSTRVMLSRASTTVKGPFSLVLAPGWTAHDGRDAWLSQVSEEIQALTGMVPSVASLDDMNAWQNNVCILLAEMEGPFVDGMDEATFEKVRSLLTHSSGLLWLSCGGQVDAADPAFGTTDGLLRTARQEDAGKRWIRLDFEHGRDPWASDKIPHVLHVLQQSFDPALEPTDVEWEFAVKESQLRVARVYPDKAQDALATNLDVDLVPELQPFHQEGRPLIWETPTSGLVGLNPYFVDNRLLAATGVPSGMVEVEAKAFGLNFRDVLVQLGQLEEPLKGHECSGIITALGPDTEQSGLQVGDRVCGMVWGRIASRGRTSWTSVAKLPDDLALSWEEAAAFPTAYATAYGCLVQTARLKKGETVLIHAAAGGTGQAAVVVAQSVGAHVFATCSTQTKRDLLVRQYGLDPGDIFSSRDASFAPAILARTGGKGVDVVLNSLSGPLLKATWDCMARFGRFLDISKVDMEANRHLGMAPFGRCATYTGFDLLQQTMYCGQLTHAALADSLRIVRERQRPPIYPITPYGISDMGTAMRQMQGGAHMGKIVLVPRPGDKVSVVTRPPPIDLARDDATYLIAGGLTGIGLAITRWMFGKGARNLLLVSRNATSHPAAARVREEAEIAGCRVEIRDCDIADENSLLQLLGDCSVTLPPIRGAINAAMVLDDTVMERMTFEQWRNAVRPKVDGSRNLHNHLPDMAFFVMLASFAGACGHMSQANYAAGNTFQDALARHRTARGLPAVALDLSGVLSVGAVADREASGDEGIRARLETVGFGSVDIEAVLRLVEAAIRDPLRATPSDSHLVVGSYSSIFTNPDSIVRRDRRFGTLRGASKRGADPGSAAENNTQSSTAALIQALSTVSSIGEGATLLETAIAAKLAGIFNVPVAEIDVSLPLSRFGVDSLVAVELRNWLNSSVKASVSVFEVLQCESLSEFAMLVATKSDHLSRKDLGEAKGN